MFVTHGVHRWRDGRQGLGFDHAAVYVSHPVQDRTDEEMRAMADQAFAEIVRTLEEN